MNGMISKLLSVTLILGLALWGPAVPWAMAQLEVDAAELHTALASDPELAADPELASLCSDQVEAIAADSTGEVAKQVELAATTIEKATQSVSQLDPQAVATEAQARLVASGVPAEEAARVGSEMTKALEAIQLQCEQGRTIADLDFSQVSSLMEGMSRYFEGGASVPEMLGGAPGEMGRPDFQIAWACMESCVNGSPDAVMVEHLRGEVGGLMAQGPEGLTPEQMKEMGSLMEAAYACGVNPGEFMHEGTLAGGFSTEGMSPEHQAMLDAWQKGGELSTFQMEGALQAGATPEMVAHMTEMQSLEQAWHEATDPALKEAIEKYAAEVTSQSADRLAETTANTAEKYADGHPVCPAGKAHQAGVADGPGHCL